MKITQTDIPDLLVIEPTIFKDQRGYFFESYNSRKFEQAQLHITFVQDNESASSYGVLRGLHYQIEPFAQTKLVRVIEGSVLDVAVDIRPGSPTFGKHHAIELSAENKLQFLVPKGFAHGYVVLSPTAIFAYKCDQFYSKEHERGIRYNDTNLGIDWILPAENLIVNERDQNFPTLES